VRLHSLSITAFGPFAGTETVDVDVVARDGLFLLWGPTGAGKTTLLDAVVFALYGTVPGVRGEEKRLRSDHADAATRTEVSCELTLAGERLLVARRPEQTRPKKRGTGETTEQARLTVQRWDGATWDPVSTRIDEGSEYLRVRLGLSAEQFCQVVLLPQGDFARFLRAEPEDRARLLRTLFDVGRFARAEDWLAAERRAAEEVLRSDRERLGRLLDRVAHVADVAVPEELAPELVGARPGASVDAWVAAVRTRAAGDLASATAAAETAAAESSRLDGELVAGTRSELTLTVRQDGQPVQDLQPYLGAFGHLVALRDGDLAYLHVHPAGEPGDGTTEPGPDVTFYATAPSAGDYRLFLDFQHDGVVRTAEFTARAGEPAVGAAAAPTDQADEHASDGHGHG